MHCNNGLNNKLVESLVENKVAQETGDLKYLQDSMYDFVSTLKEIILGEYSPEFFNKYVDEALKLHGSNLEEFLKIPKMGLELRQALESIDDAIDTSNQEFKDNLVLLLDRFQTTLDNMEYQARDPYDTAVELGFTGTKQEWLEHLEGDSAYEIAVKNGYTGSEVDWLNYLEGDSAYKIAVDNGFVGTKQEWLTSLKPTEGTLQALTQFMNNDAGTEVTIPELGNIPSLQGHIKQMFESGGLPATPFTTKALMTASALVDGDYAMVIDDTDNNGLYVKSNNEWVVSDYSPQMRPKNLKPDSHADSVETSGVYLIPLRTLAPESLGYPPNSGGFLEVYRQEVGSAYGIQRFTSLDGSVYLRFKSTKWQQWEKIGLSLAEQSGLADKSYVNSQVDLLDDELNFLEDILTPAGVIDNRSILAGTGKLSTVSEYEASDFIPVELGDRIEYTGATQGAAGIASYDKDKIFVASVYLPSNDGELVDNKLKFTIDNPDVAYIRVSNKKTLGVEMKVVKRTLTKDMVIDNKNSVQDLIAGNTPLTSSYDMLEGEELLEGTALLATSGFTHTQGMEDYVTTPFLKVEHGDSIRFTGWMVNTLGMAGYDGSQQFVEPLYYPARDGNVPPNGITIEITNPKIKYLRTCHKTTATSPEFTLSASKSISVKDLIDIKSGEAASASSPDIRVTFDDEETFWVHAKVADGSYISHKWQRYLREQHKEDLWVFTETWHNSIRIAAGNFNMVHIMLDIDSSDGVDDAIFVGPSHGCEETEYNRFFIDGTEFDPTTQAEPLEGAEFKVQVVTNFYKPDRAESLAEAVRVTGRESTAFVMPAQPLEVRAKRIAQMTIGRLSKINREQHLNILKDNVKFEVLYGSMQRTYQPYINGHVYLNDKDGTRNYFPDSEVELQPVPPSAVVLSNGVGYGDKNCFATRFEANGAYNGYNYNLATTLTNGDSSQNHKVHAQMWIRQTGSNKMYFNPVYTIRLNESYPEFEPDTFKQGDKITMLSVSEFNISKYEA